MSVPEPHERVLPNFAVSEQGLRELEIWLMDKFGGDVFWEDVGGGASSGGDGLQYNAGTYGPLNVGDWLSVEATGYGGLLNRAVGFYLGPASSGDFEIKSDDGNLYSHFLINPYVIDLDTTFLDPTGTDPDQGLITLTSGEIAIASGGGGTLLTSTGGVQIIPDTGGVTIGGNDAVAINPADNVVIQIQTGKTLEVHDNASAVIFRITENGTYHIKTGATWIADL